MGKSHMHRVNISSLCLLLFVVQFSSLHLICCSTYAPPDKYFINCGSDRNVNDGHRSFSGHENRDSASVAFTKQRSIAVRSTDQPQSNTSAIYHTARIFKQQSSYAFKTSDPSPSTYLVRLHFFAFSSSTDLSAAVFEVAALPGVLLLHNFTAKGSTETPLVEEFYVTINNTKKFRIYFTPRESSFAFVNAIEFFPAPPVIFSIDEATRVGSGKKAVSSSVLRTVYRINVGGDEIKPVNDTIWRKWDPDDGFLETKDRAKNIQSYSAELKYPSEEARLAAPDWVYQTAKQLKNVNGTSGTGNSNITWNFEVNKSAGHIVRAHFCDFVSISLNTLFFNFSVNDDFSVGINYSPGYDVSATILAQPSYFDFAVGALSSGVLKISIVPLTINEESNAFLNGLEILEIKEGLAALPIESESVAKPKLLPIVVGSVLGGFAVVCTLAAVAVFVLSRRKKAEPSADHSSWGHVASVFGGGTSHSRITELMINGSPVPNLHLGLRISFSEIQLATKCFSSKLLIGRGGFGSVYKGTLVNGTRLAVKRCAPESGQGLPEFQTEIIVLSSIRHRD